VQFTHHLSVRLFLLLCISLAAVFGVFLYLDTNLQQKHHLESIATSGARTSDLVVTALRHSMLQNNRIEINHAIQAVGEEEHIRGVRIINKMGQITFSSVAGEIDTYVDMSAEACLLCHSETKPLSKVTEAGRTRIYSSPAAERILGIISPIRNSRECSEAACHAHSPELTILGVLDLKMSLSRTEQFLAESKVQSIRYGIISILVFALLFGIFIYQVVQKPIKKLTTGTQELSRGNLDYQLEIYRRDEIGQLASSFNHMTRQLKAARDEIVEWNRKLEERVERKRMALRQAEERMQEIDKLASLGKLAASVAHELNNPLAGILTYAKLAERKLAKAGDRVDPEVFRHLKIMQQEMARCGNVVNNLLLFARHDGEEFQPASVHEIINKSLDIVWHKITMQNITVIKKLNLADDVLECDEARIEQALVALLVNASEAMPDGGTIRVETSAPDAGHIAIQLSDTGPGIPPEVKSHIFEPFFSTKKEGKGVGLGLSVVYGIVQSHGGAISVESTERQGTVFRITLPRTRKQVPNLA